MYPQQSNQMGQPMYPYAYSPLPHMQSPYLSQNQASTAPTQIFSGTYNPPQIPYSQDSAHTPILNESPRIKFNPSQPAETLGSTAIASSLSNASMTGSNHAPGPIPATTPLVVRQDSNGVPWIAFEYSRDRVKIEYTIRCDAESVDTATLTQQFKSENCIYPRACVPRDQYKGNRLDYEVDCNEIGWALAELNPCLREKRGLIQRAVDSWRNSGQDPRLRSRRLRRQAKMNKTRVSDTEPPQPGGLAPAGLPGSTSLPAPSSRTDNTILSAESRVYDHHGQHEKSPTTQDASCLRTDPEATESSLRTAAALG